MCNEPSTSKSFFFYPKLQHKIRVKQTVQKSNPKDVRINDSLDPGRLTELGSRQTRLVVLWA